MTKNVYILDTNIYGYNNKEYFNPNTIYPEALDFSIKSDKDVYDKVRQLFVMMELDKENIGKKSWNPFKDFIKEGDSVLIKPNLVKHINLKGTVECMITNFSLIRPVIDYTILALNGTGNIIVGDAPVQDCDFNEIKLINNLEESIEKYKEIYPKIKLMDFRKNQNAEVECITVKIN